MTSPFRTLSGLIPLHDVIVKEYYSPFF